uniref:B3 domain-containing protein REM17-like n=1 Tax=Erigeron canadensis TaxID=72917 RepID=UPI001CB97111|nr:B3 domain-containing protein REM17-like [Erigeron canadensis]
MNFKKRDGASFFKILLNNSAQYIQLPSAFAKKYMENNNKKKQTNIALKTNSDLKWKVKYFNIKDEYFFIDGWLKFVKDNSLQNGDFLVFWLQFSSTSKTIYKVYRYAPNGCLKHPAASSSCNMLDDSDDDEGRNPLFYEEKINDDSQKNLRKSITRPLTMAFEKATKILSYDIVLVKNDDGKTWNVGVKSVGHNRPYPYLIGKWSAFIKDNKVRSETNVRSLMLKIMYYKFMWSRTMEEPRKESLELKSRSNGDFG